VTLESSTIGEVSFLEEASNSPSLDSHRDDRRRLAIVVGIMSSPVGAQEGPAVVDPNLRVRTVVDGLVTPSSIAFLGPNDFLVA
jgi:hypothetical protein